MKSVLVLDVSNNDTITIAELKASGAVALIGKATEGTWFKDGTYDAMRAVAKACKVPFGAYVFLHPNAAGNEAEFFLQYAKLHKGDIEPIIDTEVADGESMAVVAARVLSCAEFMAGKGYKPLIYASSSFWENLVAAKPELRKFRVWEADYPGNLTKWFPWVAKWRVKLGRRTTVVLWQWTFTYAVGSKHFDASRLFVPLKSLLIT